MFTLLLRGLVRGFALFFGIFSALNIVISRFGAARAEDIWWIQFDYLPSWAVAILSAILAVALICYAVKPEMGMPRRAITTGVCLVYAIFALVNVFEYYSLLNAGAFTTRFPVPFSLFIVFGFLLTGVVAWVLNEQKTKIAEIALGVVFALLGVLLFPLAQIYTFGFTDYSREADVAVVFGARAFADGRLSTTLRDRVDRSIELYHDGYVPKLLFTGGVDADGVNEPQMMKAYAVSHGVDPVHIILDDQGNNTDLSARNTVPIFHEMGATRVLAISQNFHLPRIKMTYRAEGFNVLTVPAHSDHFIPGTHMNLARETVAFWAYWLRSGVRDLRVP
ncbi:MAG: YdcF family protein [Coriobacteriia bacterium]|nr:YdcF family protein [Coriobacteriia bacterium]MCL2870654.1 YdcF family protein [Coriobacteriia bacterium]